MHEGSGCKSSKNACPARIRSLCEFSRDLELRMQTLRSRSKRGRPSSLRCSFLSNCPPDEEDPGPKHALQSMYEHEKLDIAG